MVWYMRINGPTIAELLHEIYSIVSIVNTFIRKISHNYLNIN